MGETLVEKWQSRPKRKSCGESLSSSDNDLLIAADLLAAGKKCVKTILKESCYSAISASLLVETSGSTAVVANLQPGPISANPLPGNTIPANPLPGNQIPVNPLPGNAIPANPLPGNLNPANLLPGNLNPANPLPGNLMPATPIPDYPGYIPPQFPGSQMPDYPQPIEDGIY